MSIGALILEKRRKNIFSQKKEKIVMQTNASLNNDD